MLRARASIGMAFAGFTTGGSKQKRQRLAVERKILFCRRRGAGCIQTGHQVRRTGSRDAGLQQGKSPIS
jgi:hypothetical protein